MPKQIKEARSEDLSKMHQRMLIILKSEVDIGSFLGDKLTLSLIQDSGRRESYIRALVAKRLRESIGYSLESLSSLSTQDED